MARQKGTANFSGTLEVLAGGPIDARSVVPTLADLTVASNFPYAYVGMETYVVSENKKYRLIAADVTRSSNWEEIGSGGGGGGEEGGKMLTGTLLAAGWTNNAQTVTVTGVKSDTIGTVGILSNATAAQVEAAKSAGIVATGLGTNSVSFKCDSVPAIDIPFGVLIPGGSSGGDIDVDDALSPTSENPVQNKVIKAALDGKVNAVNGKGLSTNDYTTEEKNKLAGLSNYDDTALRGLIAGKQDQLTPGNGIDITNNVISAGIPIVANQFEKSDIYSTTEKIVGCWTDGRPVYQKVIDFGAGPNATAKSVEHGVSNISTVVKMLIIAISGSGSSSGGSLVSFALDSATLNSSGQKTFTFLQADKITIRSDIDQSAKTFKIIFQYTKTTDAANSFKYADENDYSTTEHIVGSWIDGKLIYQKTFYVESLPENSNINITHNISNFDTLLDVSGYCKKPDGKTYPIPFSATDGVCIIDVPSSIATTGFRLRTSGWQAGEPSRYHAYFTVKYTKTTD